MLHGDISNHVKATFGFMCENFIVEYKDNKLTDKVLNALIGKTKRATINPIAVGLMEKIYRQTEYNVDLIINEKNYTSDLKGILEDLPFNRIVLYNKISQVSSRLLTGDLTYVIDDDTYRRGLINSRNALSLKDFSSMLKIGGN